MKITDGKKLLQNALKEMYHETELTIRAINRRLESYGKIEYTPAFSREGEKSHLEQYNVLESKVYSLFSTLAFRDEDGNYRRDIVGRKGNYIQISRSKDTLRELYPYLESLKQIVEQTPTWQETLKQAELEEGRKLTRKEKIEAVKKMSTIRKIENLQEFLGDSENVDPNDHILQDLLRPFRGARKGGTRQKGEKVSQADFDALVDYVKFKYMGDDRGVRGVMVDIPDPDAIKKITEETAVGKYIVNGKIDFTVLAKNQQEIYDVLPSSFGVEQNKEED